MNEIHNTKGSQILFWQPQIQEIGKREQDLFY